MKLLLPLKYYDDAGRVKPAVALYFCIVFLSRSLLILIGSISVRENGEQYATLTTAGCSPRGEVCSTEADH